MSQDRGDMARRREDIVGPTGSEAPVGVSEKQGEKESLFSKWPQTRNFAVCIRKGCPRTEALGGPSIIS